MGDAIVIKVTLDDSEVTRAADNIARKLRASLNVATGSAAAGPTHAFRDQEAAALRLAQAQARLAVASGNLRGAQTTLSTALANSTRQTVTQIGAQTQLAQIQQRVDRAVRDSTASFQGLGASVGRLSVAFGALAAVGVASLFVSFAEASLEAAISVDKQVSSLTALIGSAEAAEARFKELIRIAQQTPGLTTALAATLDTQLRILNVTEQTINRVLPAVGRLNAISPLGDPAKFAGNLVQLVTQNFERQDLKELVGNSPFAGELIKQIFDVNSPTNAKAIRESAKRLGIDTVEEFFKAFSDAAENNPRLQAVTESLGTQFEKLRDRLTIAIAPVGRQLAKTLIPIFDDLVAQVEKFGDSAARVFEENRGDIRAAAREITALAVEVGKLIGGFAASPQIREFFKMFATESARVRDVLESSGSERAKRLFGISKGPNQIAVEEKFNNTLATGETVQEFEARLQKDAQEMLKRLEGRGGRAGTGTGAGGAGDGAAVERQRQKSELQRAIEDVTQLTRQVEALEAGTGKLFEKELKLFQTEFERERLKKRREELGFIRAKIARGEPFAPQLPGGIGLPTLPLTAAGSPAGVIGPVSIISQSATDADTAEVNRNRTDLLNQQLRIQEVQIQNQVNRGLLTEAEAQRQLAAVRRAARGEIIATLEAQLKAVGANTIEGLQIIEQIERTKTLGVELSNAERFMRGFGSATESVGEAFERLGQNVSRALTNTKDLLSNLKQAVIQFFNDLLGQQIQGLLRSIFAPIVGAIGGGGAGGGTGGGGIGAIFGNIFRTPSTFPSGLSSGTLQSFANAAGGGLAAPPSISSGIAQFFGASVPRSAGVVRGGIDEFIGAGVPRTAGNINFSLGAFGKSIGQSLAAAAPFLGFSLGSSLGGQSTAGQILGGVGGSLGGLVLGAATKAIGGGLGKAFALSGALGPAALIAAPLLIAGGILLGRAKQRGQDEAASGQFLTQAINGITELKAAIASDQIDGNQAGSIFDSQILGPFVQQIKTLKTKSVVDSRLQNQTRDLRRMFDDLIPPEVEAQRRRRLGEQRSAAIDSRLIPQFAIGGITRGGLAILHPDEMILTPHHQFAVRAIAGGDIFDRVGVPGVQPKPVFDQGGIMGPVSSPGGPMVIQLNVQVGMSAGDARQIVASATNDASGEDIIVNVVQRARGRGRKV